MPEKDSTGVTVEITLKPLCRCNYGSGKFLYVNYDCYAVCCCFDARLTACFAVSEFILLMPFLLRFVIFPYRCFVVVIQSLSVILKMF